MIDGCCFCLFFFFFSFCGSMIPMDVHIASLCYVVYWKVPTGKVSTGSRVGCLTRTGHVGILIRLAIRRIMNWTNRRLCIKVIVSWGSQ